MKTSLLNVRITFQRQETVVDEICNHMSQWTDYYTCWATATTSGQSATESKEAGQTLETDKLDFTVRYCQALANATSTGYRIKMGERVYDIDSVNYMSFKRNSLKFQAHLVRR